MSEQGGLVLVAGYRDLDAARRDFDGLNARVKDKSIALRGAVMVGKDASGKPTLIDTGNHLGRRGAAWGAGVGLTVGLFSPALLASAVVGGAAGAMAGTFADHRLKSGLADKIGQALAEGTAVVIAVLPIGSRLAVEQVLAGAPLKSVVELEHSTLAGLESSLTEAMGKFNPDRTRLPLPDRTFGGTVGRTLDESVGDWTIVAGAKAPDDAPNVLIVLIDDAGLLYYFPDDLTDKAVQWLHGVRAQDHQKPWMMYYSTGCSHAPHHVAKEWADKYQGQFDDGWDVYREKTLERQKKLGVVPQDTELTDRPELFPAWDSLSDTQKKLYARQMEVFAGFSENADWNVGRLLDAIDGLGDLDNTVIF